MRAEAIVLTVQTLRIAAGDDDGFATECDQRLGGMFDRQGIGHRRLIQQQRRFRAIRGDHIGTGQQLVAIRLDQVGLGKAGPRRCAQNRVDHDGQLRVLQTQTVNPPYQHPQILHAAYHADFDGRRRHIFCQRSQLRLKNSRINRRNQLHAHRILRRDRGYNGAAMYIHGLKSAQISLQASAGAGV